MGIAVGVALVIGAPDGASAKAAPGGCRAAGQFTASMAREDGSAFGEFSSELSALDLRDEFVHGIHAAFCAPGA